MSSKAAFDARALREFGTLGRVIERFWIRNVSRGTTMNRRPREKFDHARREISVDFHHFSVPSDKFKKCDERKKKKKITFKFGSTPHFTFGWTSPASVVTDNRKFCRFDLTSCSFPTVSLESPFFFLEDSRNTVISVTLEKHLVIGNDLANRELSRPVLSWVRRRSA